MLKLTTQAELALRRSHNIHLAIVFVVFGIEVATDHGVEDCRLVNQLREVIPGREVNTVLGRHFEVEALSDELSPALRQLVAVDVWTELVGVIRRLELIAQHLFINLVETFC